MHLEITINNTTISWRNVREIAEIVRSRETTVGALAKKNPDRDEGPSLLRTPAAHHRPPPFVWGSYVAVSAHIVATLGPSWVA